MHEPEIMICIEKPKQSLWATSFSIENYGFKSLKKHARYHHLDTYIAICAVNHEQSATFDDIELFWVRTFSKVNGEKTQIYRGVVK